MGNLERELADILSHISAGHDIVPFMQQLLPVSDVRFAIVPDDLMFLLAESADFQMLCAGAPPTWFQISDDADQAAELIIYCARADGRRYVIAPAMNLKYFTGMIF